MDVGIFPRSAAARLAGRNPYAAASTGVAMALLPVRVALVASSGLLTRLRALRS
jgi:hypothetical protein